ncbi:hypothetical protein WDU94_012267 [Cyamophila willieti]
MTDWSFEPRAYVIVEPVIRQELLETTSQLPSNHPLDLDHTQALEEILQPNPVHDTQLSVHDTQLYSHDTQLSEHDTQLFVSDTQPPVPTHHTHLPLTKPADDKTQTTDPVPTKQQVDPEPELATSTVPDSIFNIIESVASDVNITPVFRPTYERPSQHKRHTRADRGSGRPAKKRRFSDPY